MRWIEIQKPAPILNTPDFETVFSGTRLPVDEKGHPFHFELVGLPGMRFQFLQATSSNIFQILWPKYDVKPLYIDRRFVLECSEAPGKKASLPSAQFLLNHMEKRLGTPYVWGGNWAEGIPEMLELYPPTGKLEMRIKELWTLQGLDCSGLLFEASNGITPRNTSHLLQYGTSLDHEDFSKLLPMDMIVFPGHVLFVRDSETIIESKSPFGVRIRPLFERLLEIQQERKFIRNWTSTTNPAFHFTIRRFTS